MNRPMQRDRVLIPVEGLRLAALGILASRGPTDYATLATMVRLFATSYGASPVDVMSSSIELLRFEGLIGIGDEGEDPGSARVTLLPGGREELERLMLAPVRASSASSRLMVALKIRFFRLLDATGQGRLAEVLGDTLRSERARLVNLRRHMEGEDPGFLAWLDRDIARTGEDLAWLEGEEALMAQQRSRDDDTPA